MKDTSPSHLETYANIAEKAASRDGLKSILIEASVLLLMLVGAASIAALPTAAWLWRQSQ